MLEVLDVNKLYPQYQPMPDRRKQDSMVPFERRSGDDRRTPDRVQLDTNLTRDIFEIKNKVEQLQKVVEASGLNFTQNASNTIYSDQFVTTNKNPQLDKAMKNTEPPTSTSILAGILAVTLGGVVAGAFFGTAGVAVALGIGAYMGGKALKQAVVEHMTESEKNTRKKKK